MTVRSPGAKAAVQVAVVNGAFPVGLIQQHDQTRFYLVWREALSGVSLSATTGLHQ